MSTPLVTRQRPCQNWHFRSCQRGPRRPLLGQCRSPKRHTPTLAWCKLPAIFENTCELVDETSAFLKMRRGRRKKKNNAFRKKRRKCSESQLRVAETMLFSFCLILTCSWGFVLVHHIALVLRILLLLISVFAILDGIFSVRSLGSWPQPPNALLLIPVVEPDLICSASSRSLSLRLLLLPEPGAGAVLQFDSNSRERASCFGLRCS